MDYYAGDTPYSLVIADLNRDSHPDLILTNRTSETVSVLLNRGNGTFRERMEYETGHQTYSVVAIDLQGDSYADLAVTSCGDDTVSLLLNTVPP
jgi:hypothetical protein